MGYDVLSYEGSRIITAMEILNWKSAADENDVIPN